MLRLSELALIVASIYNKEVKSSRYRLVHLVQIGLLEIARCTSIPQNQNALAICCTVERQCLAFHVRRHLLQKAVDVLIQPVLGCKALDLARRADHPHAAVSYRLPFD